MCFTSIRGAFNMFNLFSKNDVKVGLMALASTILWSLLFVASVYQMKVFYRIWQTVCTVHSSKYHTILQCTKHNSSTAVYHTTLFKVPHHSSMYQTSLFSVPHYPIQSTTPLFNVPHYPLRRITPIFNGPTPPLQIATPLFNVPNHTLQCTISPSSKNQTPLFKVPFFYRV